MSSHRTDIRLANEAWESLMTAHARLSSDFSAKPIWGEASMREYDVLYTLVKRGEAMRLCDLQEEVLLSQPALSRMVDRLATRGLVVRKPDPEDGRAKLIEISEEGARVQREVGRAHGRDIGQAMRALSPDELRELQRLTQKLIASRST
ncbi:MarR family winged helix-turn-helix transcriptional regulator [Leucobacter aridicollis]|uniref:DNA-binding MarR family transcriptional regulator n=1 Tax=Leucobacter aridicollis TaxID=283878 RepID=A0A852R6F7_9MICO|nr:MarR family transcriptional regulator [Leucobacter aridicollis]NYD28447.1 DNA-binding MarR family transcriptional regulator [Leucobacter aridicollis]